jgi:DnaK suppressor protein
MDFRVSYNVGDMTMPRTTERQLETLKKIGPYKAKKGEEYMNAKQLAHFEKLLIGVKEELLAGSDRTVHEMQEEAASPADILDKAAKEEEFALKLRARDRELKLIKKIEEALDSINRKEYGYCEICGAEIGIGRLEARPTATQCIDCKTVEEIRERQGMA